MSDVAISAVVNLHAEGMLAHASLLSAEAARVEAARHGLDVEILVVLDNADHETVEYLAESPVTDCRLLRVDCRDPGEARNRGVEAAQGRYIGFLDGDDLWAPNWLVAAYNAAEGDAREIVWHPSFNLRFGASPSLYGHVDMEDVDFDILQLSELNYWTALSFAKREIYQRHPYPRTRLEHQFGYEDWHWNLKTIENGILHKCVSGTVHFIRERSQSQSWQSADADVLMLPTDLFKEMLRPRG